MFVEWVNLVLRSWVHLSSLDGELGVEWASELQRLWVHRLSSLDGELVGASELLGLWVHGLVSSWD